MYCTSKPTGVGIRYGAPEVLLAMASAWMIVDDQYAREARVAIKEDIAINSSAREHRPTLIMWVNMD